MLNVLNNILATQFSVTVESSGSLVNEVQQAVQQRANSFVAKGQTPPRTKQPIVFNALLGTQQWNIRSIDLLRKIGELTTPTSVNLAQLSASWATRRYFWAIDGGPAAANMTSPFRLSADARDLDFHQKTLLSDEFGIGMAGLLMEKLVGAPNFVDISAALDDPGNYQNITRTGSTQPDYLMWGNGTPYYVVECKGSQTKRSTSIDQLRRGLEQVPSVTTAAGARNIETVVVATFLDGPGTYVYVIDPPADNHDDDGRNRNKQNEKASERLGERSWTIRNPELFETRVWTGQQISILRWAGQHRTAEHLAEELNIQRHVPYVPTDTALETRETALGEYVGVSSPLLPELGRQAPTIFTGVDAELMDHIKTGRHAQAREDLLKHRQVANDNPYQSFGANGTCMVISGLG